MVLNLTDNWQMAKILTDNWRLYTPTPQPHPDPPKNLGHFLSQSRAFSKSKSVTLLSALFHAKHRLRVIVLRLAHLYVLLLRLGSSNIVQ